MSKIVLSICSGDALNEFHYFRKNKLDYDTNFIFYDPIYKHNLDLKKLIKDLYHTFYPLNLVYFCVNVDEIRSLLKNNTPILLIGFNIQEMYVCDTKCLDLTSYIMEKKKEQGLLSVCNLLWEKNKNIKVHIQMENKITFDNLDDFRQDLILNM